MIAGFYCIIWMGMTKVAQKRGYCLAIHGSINRDLDVVAIPWTKGAVSPQALVNAFVRECKLQKLGILDQYKPHGRMTQTLGFPKDYGEYGHHYIDISIMPRASQK